MTRPQQIEAELVRDPLQSAGDIAKKFGISPASVYSACVQTWGVRFGDLRRQVFDTHFQRIDGDDHD